ncbi:thioester-containing protein 1 allele S3-like isoform X2 [Malaya genurostris]|uniref:thioester-containing protein 1 allele S3-like isoform X2 n=1 Tax=Malaya genurostris TaxID=325434 RepID=UPI0026F407F9|nr:thioester-containing protein 1 allele S3-like isoform X2 [Malaya genurostris]
MRLSVIGPKLIRRNSTYTVSFSNSLQHNVRLAVQLDGFSEGNSVFNKSTNVVVARRTGRSASFEVGDIPTGEYSLSIRSIDSSFGYSDNVELLYDPKVISIFIQTDKPVYKPGDILRFRVILVDVDTRPVKYLKTINIGLQDADKNSIREWQFARLYNGIFESAVQLASSPLLGNWTLTVNTDYDAGQKQFEVREYVLPKFFVKAYPSEILLLHKKQVIVTVESAYTFGKPVDGTVQVDLYLKEDNRKADFSTKTYISGVTTISFNLSEPLEIEDESFIYRDVFVKVTVMETFTNRTANVSQAIPIYEHPYKISVIKSTPLFRPGLPFPIDVSVMDHYDSPPSSDNDAVIAIRFEGNDLEEEFTLTEPVRNGLASLVLNPPAKAYLMEIGVKYDSVDYETIATIDGAQSKSNQYIRIILKPKYKIRANKEVVFEISCTESMNHFSYTIISRGSVVTAGNVMVHNKKKYDFRLKLTPQMAPKARIIVSYTKNFLIYDDLELNFETFNNDFKFTLDTEEYRPGQDLYVDVEAASDSYVAFAAIDQSVLLLDRDGHDFTKNDVLKDLSLYGATDGNEYDPFHTMGLFLRTTAEVDFPFARNTLMRFGDQFYGLSKSIQKAVHIRTEFPESWLWKNYTMSKNRNVLSFNDTVPDTITSWIVTGFALSPTLGLGLINQPQSFIVNQQFYIVVNLPYSIKRDEVTLIQVTVFNFLGNTLTTDVTLFNKNDEIEFVEKSSNDTTRRTKAIIVPTSNGKPISFMIKAKKLGEIAIKVEARNLLKSDAAEHMLRVTPESRLHEKNEARFIELDSYGTQRFDIPIDIPQNIDEGSSRIMFTLDSDILGTAIKNLESLIRLPSGCGEQNMLNFVPNIVVLDYLSETGTIEESVKTKAINYLQSGYQNQLKYKLSSGAFSVWPNNHPGSTFLTAFVAKSFKIAAKYIDVDLATVKKAFEWLSNNQKPDGRFDEVGQVIHADMQGGLRSSNFALTAYVLIAFLENADIAMEHNLKLKRTVQYLANNFPYMTDEYDLALTTYAMSLYRHPSREDYLNKLLENSIFNKTLQVRYWNRHPVSVEVAGYALLSYVTQGRFVDATPIMRWLNQQRFGLGGFPGTQDTFVGMKALAKFAAKTSAHRNDYRVEVLHKPARKHTVDIDKTMAFAVQERELPSHIRHAQITVTGIGHGVLQVAYQYYMNIQNDKPSFKLDVEMLNTTTYNVQHLQVCTKYIPKEAYQRSNMALIEIFFPSGLVAEADAVQDLSPQKEIRRTELRFAATSVVVYYDNLGTETNCFKVTAYRRFKVAMHRPAHVVVYDYYDRDRFAIKTYEGKVMQLCDICEDEDCLTLSC